MNTGAARIPVSAIVMTKNEAANIEKCLASIHDFSEVFVVDSQSTDGTQELARSGGAQVVDFVWDGRYPKKKQWCLENIDFSNDWVLYLDADEEVTPELHAEIAALFSGSPPHAGYFVAYDYVFLHRRLKHGHRIHKLVLFDRKRGAFPQRDDLAASRMWEVEGHYQPAIRGSVGKLRHPMVHHDHDELYDYFDRHNRYSDWEAVVRDNSEVRGDESELPLRRLLKRAFDRLPFKGAVAFLHAYVLGAGFRDGREGLHFAIARGFYYWQIHVKQIERRKAAAEQGTPADG